MAKNLTNSIIKPHKICFGKRSTAFSRRHAVLYSLRLRSVPSPKEKSTLLSALGTQLSRFRHRLDLGKPGFGRKKKAFSRGKKKTPP